MMKGLKSNSMPSSSNLGAKEPKNVKEVSRTCQEGSTCLRREDCLYMQSEYSCLLSIGKEDMHYRRILMELRLGICNKEERAFCCPDSKKNEKFQCFSHETKFQIDPWIYIVIMVLILIFVFVKLCLI